MADTGLVTPERFARGMTFDEYVRYVGTAENLAREGSQGDKRRDWSGYLRDRHAKVRLTPHQVAAITWLAAQPGGPARVLVIAEEWSSDCRRDVPVLQRLAEAGGLELRIFPRDGAKFTAGRPDPANAPNADLMLAYLNRRDGQEFASIPVAVFFDRGFDELHRYIEFPAIFHKDRVVSRLRAARPGETAEQTKTRGQRDFFAMLDSPFFDVWACAGIDEILSALHERLVLP